MDINKIDDDIRSQFNIVKRKPNRTGLYNCYLGNNLLDRFNKYSNSIGCSKAKIMRALVKYYLDQKESNGKKSLETNKK